ncbi:cyclic AMP-dependent transcription factor ATF-6 beta isoform X3 [Grus americana]|uniref:cyclic AMP-dependent transcription factor ATF-6 beta isoform X3 n=1 Tax=Grus americana TaxID=9117 RepID=UPI00240820CA|nr:cyclic AMP-dependent transcription factor ATF-6 beta isoform X3 [Grus americana]
MAALAPELLVLSDAGRFRADNLLGAEDWDAALYGCLDDRLEPAHLFPSLDPDPMFDCAFEGGDAASPPDPPWDQEPPSLFPDLQVKSEPGSPTSSHCSDSSSFSSASEPPAWAPSPPEPGVKTEPIPPLPCAPPDTAGKAPRAVKAEGPPPNRRTPPIQPKPPGGATGPGQAAPSPPQTILLQPLPGAASPLPAAITVPAPAVLLSPAELLLPRLLCLPPPGQGPPRTSPGPPKPEAKTIVPAPAPAPPGPQEVDAKVLKRQQRMIKNRESACQSRRRRKEYVQGLEERLRQALADNDRLRRENGLLRRRLDALLGQSSELRPAPGPRKLACLAALLLFLAFNLGPLRNSSLGAVTLRELDGLFRASDCRRFNRTESLRLADELSGWVRRHQIDRRKPGSPPRPARSQFQASPPWKAPTSSRLVPVPPPHPERAPPGQLQLYRPDRAEPHFLAAIDRRDDTFYVVSFRRDHLLLPAISHNKTSRPKMSLVMPAAALNESLSGRGGGLEAMMQVDCEVMDTRVIHVRRRPPPHPPANRSRAPTPPRPPPPPPGPLPGGGWLAPPLGVRPRPLRGKAPPPQRLGTGPQGEQATPTRGKPRPLGEQATPPGSVRRGRSFPLGWRGHAPPAARPRPIQATPPGGEATPPVSTCPAPYSALKGQSPRSGHTPPPGAIFYPN